MMSKDELYRTMKEYADSIVSTINQLRDYPLEDEDVDHHLWDIRRDIELLEEHLSKTELKIAGLT